jgi:hypothetical protein
MRHPRIKPNSVILRHKAPESANSGAFPLNMMIFLLLTLVLLAHKMGSQVNGQRGRVPASVRGAEGASLERANPDETLRQKDPVPEQTLENPVCWKEVQDTDGVSLLRSRVRPLAVYIMGDCRPHK